MPMRNAVMFVYNDAQRDTRVWREARSLKEAGWTVTVIARSGHDLPARLETNAALLIRVDPGVRGTAPGDPSPWRLREANSRSSRIRWLAGYARELLAWRKRALLVATDISQAASPSPVVWHGHDLTGALVAYAARRTYGGRLIYDSHELYLEAGSAAKLPGLLKRLIALYEGRVVRNADVVITVNQSIAKELSSRYGVPSPVIVMNCPRVPWGDGNREHSPLRRTFSLSNRRVLMHHGGIAEGRGIRQAIGALRMLPDDVVLAIVGDGELVPELRLVAARPEFRDRIFLHPAIPMEELPNWVAGADVGLVTFEAVDRNNFYGSPNKLFEYLAAGVPVVASAFPEMQAIVQGSEVGRVCDPSSVSSIKGAIQSILGLSERQRTALRAHCLDVARTTYSWQRQETVLIAAYESPAART